MAIQFRPHHFLCALCFQGNGYSPEFVKNFSGIMQQLNSPVGNQTTIEVVAETDSICSPCPSRRGTLCTQQAKISNLDQAHAKILNLSPGDKITWEQAKNRIADSMTLEKFHAACAPCEWKKLGICENVLTDLTGFTSHSRPDK